MIFDPRNILIIDFGQLGDVVMSLPALRAVRDKFRLARITVAVGKPGAELISMSGYVDTTIEIDRVALRDGFKPVSILKIFDIIKGVRRQQFDFVIDLHSFSETNLLGFLSRAPQRLFARRPGRSLDFLANFSPKPPVDRNDPNQHLVDRYLDVLKPLGIENAPRIPRLSPRPRDYAAVDAILRKAKANTGSPLIGLFPGAGHPGRRWPLMKFSQLADSLVRNDNLRPLIFVGPEERHMLKQIRELYPAPSIVLDGLSIPEVAAAQSRLAVFVSNDTGPAHIAAAVGTPVVVLMDVPTPHAYIPVSNYQRLMFSDGVATLEVEDVYAATLELLRAHRTEALFSS